MLFYYSVPEHFLKEAISLADQLVRNLDLNFLCIICRHDKDCGLIYILRLSESDALSLACPLGGKYNKFHKQAVLLFCAKGLINSKIVMEIS